MKYVVMLLALASVSACQTTVENDEYKVSVEEKDGHHAHGDGDFCPPGQAKKGNC